MRASKRSSLATRPKPGESSRTQRSTATSGAARGHGRHGLTGDHLWVRETWAPSYFENGEPAYKARLERPPIWVRETQVAFLDLHAQISSRIKLDSRRVEVQAPQKITFEDMIAEGDPQRRSTGSLNRYGECRPENWRATTLIKWIKRWNSIHGCGSYQWDDRIPGVWGDRVQTRGDIMTCDFNDARSKAASSPSRLTIRVRAERLSDDLSRHPGR